MSKSLTLNVYYNKITIYKKPLLVDNKQNKIIPNPISTRVSRSSDTRRRSALASISPEILKDPLAFTFTADLDFLTIKKHWQTLQKKIKRKNPDVKIYWQIETASKPHIHGIISGDNLKKTLIIEEWCNLASASKSAQLIKKIYDFNGWIKYLSKPAINQAKSGRSWHCPASITQEVNQIEVDESEFYKTRRLINSIKKRRSTAAGHSFNINQSSNSGASIWIEKKGINQILNSIKNNQAWSNSKTKVKPHIKLKSSYVRQSISFIVKPHIKLKASAISKDGAGARSSGASLPSPTHPGVPPSASPCRPISCGLLKAYNARAPPDNNQAWLNLTVGTVWTVETTRPG